MKNKRALQLRVFSWFGFFCSWCYNTDLSGSLCSCVIVVMRWLWQHGRLCERTEGDGPGCSTDLVMSPNVIQHSQRKEGKRLREASCRPDVWLHVRLQARCSRCRSLTQAELELGLGLGRGQLQVIKGRGFYSEILKMVRYDFTWNQTSSQICKNANHFHMIFFYLLERGSIWDNPVQLQRF